MVSFHQTGGVVERSWEQTINHKNPNECTPLFYKKILLLTDLIVISLNHLDG